MILKKYEGRKNFGCVQVTELEQGWLGKVTVVNQTSLRIKHVRLGGGATSLSRNLRKNGYMIYVDILTGENLSSI